MKQLFFIFSLCINFCWFLSLSASNNPACQLARQHLSLKENKTFNRALGFCVGAFVGASCALIENKVPHYTNQPFEFKICNPPHSNKYYLWLLSVGARSSLLTGIKYILKIYKYKDNLTWWEKWKEWEHGEFAAQDFGDIHSIAGSWIAYYLIKN